MQDEIIHITEPDMECLRKLLKAEKRFDKSGRDDLQNLEAKLDQSQLIAQREVPKDVITLNSKVRLTDLGTGEEMSYTLVLPHEADIDQHRISILAPIGTAMLGYSVGDTFEWKVPGGLRRLEVKEILYQPEASEDHQP
jgi:regulator of nucleoside diphosphate kinase